MRFNYWKGKKPRDLVRVYVNDIPLLPSSVKVYFRPTSKGVAHLEVEGELWGTPYSIGDIVSLVRSELGRSLGLSEEGPLLFEWIVAAVGALPSPPVGPHGEELEPASREARIQNAVHYLIECGIAPVEAMQIIGMVGNLLPRKGWEKIDVERDINWRVGAIEFIRKGLTTLYPHNAEIRATWLQMAHPSLEGRAPRDVICTGGIVGLAEVRQAVIDQLSD